MQRSLKANHEVSSSSSSSSSSATPVVLSNTRVVELQDETNCSHFYYKKARSSLRVLPKKRESMRQASERQQKQEMQQKQEQQQEDKAMPFQSSCTPSRNNRGGPTCIDPTQLTERKTVVGGTAIGSQFIGCNAANWTPLRTNGSASSSTSRSVCSSLSVAANKSVGGSPSLACTRAKLLENLNRSIGSVTQSPDTLKRKSSLMRIPQAHVLRLTHHFNTSSSNNSSGEGLTTHHFQKNYDIYRNKNNNSEREPQKEEKLREVEEETIQEIEEENKHEDIKQMEDKREFDNQKIEKREEEKKKQKTEEQNEEKQKEEKQLEVKQEDMKYKEGEREEQNQKMQKLKKDNREKEKKLKNEKQTEERFEELTQQAGKREDYEIDLSQSLGCGSLGSIYFCRRKMKPSTSEKLVVKLIEIDENRPMSGAKQTRRIRRELDVLQVIRSASTACARAGDDENAPGCFWPYIVQMRDWFVFEHVERDQRRSRAARKSLAIVNEWVAGTDLFRLISEQHHEAESSEQQPLDTRPANAALSSDASGASGVFLTEHRVAQFVRAILRGCAFLHSIGVVHRDIKPENVMCCRNSHEQQEQQEQQDQERPPPPPLIKLVDFDCAMGPDRAAHSEMDEEERFGTTQLFTAPETYNLQATLTSAVDVWSVGVLAYDLMCGMTPFEWDGENADRELSVPESVSNILACRYSFNDEGFEDASPASLHFIRKCLVLRPETRPTAMQLLLEDDWLAGVAAEEQRKNRESRESRENRENQAEQQQQQATTKLSRNLSRKVSVMRINSYLEEHAQKQQ